MAGNRGLRVVLMCVALAAGLGAAVYLTARGPDKAPPRGGPVRVAFAAPTSGAPVAHYQAEVRDLMRGELDLVSSLEFTTVAGPVDSHVVWLMLEYYHSYEVRVRGVAAGGATGPWSEWCDLYEHAFPGETPEPPID